MEELECFLLVCCTTWPFGCYTLFGQVSDMLFANNNNKLATHALIGDGVMPLERFIL